MSKILIASDHAGFCLKEFIKQELMQKYEVRDYGAYSDARVDYPDFAKDLCDHLQHEPLTTRGILICGSGQGMAIMANRYTFVRAALCWNEEIAKLSRQHNNANVLCLSARFTNEELAKKIAQAFLTTEFEGGRHAGRVDKLSHP